MGLFITSVSTPAAPGNCNAIQRVSYDDLCNRPGGEREQNKVLYLECRK
jgi:hypothetical protein